MNHVYASSLELPDNLKALLRSCALMVPDYALTSEIMLHSNGFEEAWRLARKIVASIRLSSEQLSSQDHYDFGLRALNAIITAAGALTRTMDAPKEILALGALNDLILPSSLTMTFPYSWVSLQTHSLESRCRRLTTGTLRTRLLSLKSAWKVIWFQRRLLEEMHTTLRDLQGP